MPRRNEPRAGHFDPEEREYGTVDDAARILSCAPKTVRNLISRGELAGYRIGTQMLRVDLREVRELPQRIATVRRA